MDPNANLHEQDRILSQPTGAYHDTESWHRLDELRHALYDWLKRGGFAPEWDRYPAVRSGFRQWMRRRALVEYGL